MKEALNRLIVQVLANAKIGDPLEHKEEALVPLILCKRSSIHLYLGYGVSTTWLSILYQFWLTLLHDVSMCFIDS